MNISTNYNLSELIKSQTAISKNIDNAPDEVQKSNLVLLFNNIVEKCCTKFKCKIYVSSCFRSIALNKIIGGSKTSEHCTGQAVDLDMDLTKCKFTNKDLFFYIKDNLQFTQLIWEFGTSDNPEWVHVSFTGNNKKEVLIAKKNEQGKTIYSKL